MWPSKPDKASRSLTACAFGALQMHAQEIRSAMRLAAHQGYVKIQFLLALLALPTQVNWACSELYIPASVSTMC